MYNTGVIVHSVTFYKAGFSLISAYIHDFQLQNQIFLILQTNLNSVRALLLITSLSSELFLKYTVNYGMKCLN